jgi:UTP--glucose-1-phosphate uridylyltransferase
MPVHPTLEKDLAALDPALLARLAAHGFDRASFLSLAASVTEGDAATRRRTRNVVKGKVEPPKPGEISPVAVAAEDDARLHALGEEAMKRGELAFCTMAGGMATRMGGIVKALAEVIPAPSRRTFLDMRLAENRSASARAGHAVPLWLMTSDATHDAIVAALAEAKAPAHVAAFQQNLSLRLAPDGSLFHAPDGAPSVHATGHGDLVDALRRSKLLDRFLDTGGKYVWIVNVDNLGASVDAALLGRFIDSKKDVQCEVCAKAGDKGGAPVHAEGKLQVLEEFRMPPDFDPTTVPVFNTNTFLVRAEPLAKQALTWTYFEVEKKVDGKPAIQFERLLQEITAQMPTTYVEVPREGVASRFLPVKDWEELEKRRATIEVVAAARGMV